MAEEGVKREGTELLGLPPRKRFKVMEQHRKMEVAEEAPGAVGSHCSDITNVVNRVSPKKLTSQGFLVLEKRKYKLQQQKLQENLAPAMPPLPPRPVAVKRKQAPALPLPAPPAVRLKFQREKVDYPSSSAFKSWGNPSPKKNLSKSEAPPVAPKSSGSCREPRKDHAHKPKRHHQASFTSLAVPQHAKTWTMALGTTCSINKAQEDVEMVVREAPVSATDTSTSDEDVVVSTSTTSSPLMEPLSLNAVAEAINKVHIGSESNIVEASHIVVAAAKTVAAASRPMKDVVREVEEVEDVATDSASSVAVEDIRVGEKSLAPHGTTTAVVEAPNLDVAQADDEKEVFEKVDEPALEIPVDQKHTSGAAGESTLVDSLLGVRELEEEPESDAEKAMALHTPERRSSYLASPLTSGPPTVALVESHTDSETVGKSEDLTVAGIHKEDVAREQRDKADGDNSPARKYEEQAVKVVASAMEVDEVKERVTATTLSDSLAVAEKVEEQKTDTGLLADIDERAEKLFKRMLERESYAECDDDENGSDAQFFFAFNGLNNFNSLVKGLGAGDASTPRQKNGGGRVTDASSFDEDHQKFVERPTVHVPNKPPEEVAREMPEASSSRASEGHEDCTCLDDPEAESLVPAHGSVKLQETHCKSSKEDSDWDLDVEMPNFGFGKRSVGGMTQRVKAPGRWSQGAEVKASKLEEMADEEAVEDDDEGACDVCRSADAKPSDPIVYCDGCDIPVHADCYGNPLSHGIPEGDWFCAQCQSKRPDSRNCCLCPRNGGVMKMTTDGHWAHLSCAVFVPEVFYRNADDMEGIDTSHVPSKRYLAKCCVCKSNGGACVDCTEIGCKSKFHVSCALKRDLAMEFRNGRSGAIVISFCQEHTAAWDEQQERKGRSKYKIVSREPQKIKVVQRSKLK